MIFEEGSIRGCRMGHGMKWVLTSWIFALQLACAQVPVGAMLHGDTNQPADIQAWAASLQSLWGEQHVCTHKCHQRTSQSLRFLGDNEA